MSTNRSVQSRLHRSIAVGATVAGLASAAFAATGLATASAATPGVAPAASASAHRTFTTLGDQNDPTFNQLLGINDRGQIAGYFGIGTSATVHPNRGYVINAPYQQSNFMNENFPGAAQTQVIGINNSSTTVGFYADPQGDNFGFVLKNGAWTAVIDPHTTGTMNQLLGLNNFGVAVGFYTDAAGTAHAYRFNFHNDTFSGIRVPGATSTTATGINAQGDVGGFYVDQAGDTRSFLLTAGGKLTSFTAPGSTNTTALGLNNADELVGSYVTGSGAGAATHGFTWSGGRLRTVDDPQGQGTTVINGVNNEGDLVGFFSQGANVDGFVARP